MASGVDPVAVAFANANQGKADLAAEKQRQDQVYSQVLQGAQVMNSMAERSRARQQQERQFLTAKDLQERQFAFNQKQSIAQMSLAKQRLAADEKSMTVAEAEAAQLMTDKPILQEIQNDLSNAVADPRNKDKYTMAAQKKSVNLGPKGFGMYERLLKQTEDTDTMQSLQRSQDNFAKAQANLQTRLWDADINPQRAIQQDGTIDAEFAEELINEKKRQAEENKITQSREQATFESGLRKKENLVDVSTTTIDEDTGAKTTTRKRVAPGEEKASPGSTPAPSTFQFIVDPKTGKLIKK